MSETSKVEAAVGAAVDGEAIKGINFFAVHPRAIAIGAGVAGLIVGFLLARLI